MTELPVADNRAIIFDRDQHSAADGVAATIPPCRTPSNPFKHLKRLTLYSHFNWQNPTPIYQLGRLTFKYHFPGGSEIYSNCLLSSRKRECQIRKRNLYLFNRPLRFISMVAFTSNGYILSSDLIRGCHFYWGAFGCSAGDFQFQITDN